MQEFLDELAEALQEAQRNPSRQEDFVGLLRRSDLMVLGPPLPGDELASGPTEFKAGEPLQFLTLPYRDSNLLAVFTSADAALRFAIDSVRRPMRIIGMPAERLLELTYGSSLAVNPHSSGAIQKIFEPDFAAAVLGRGRAHLQATTPPGGEIMLAPADVPLPSELERTLLNFFRMRPDVDAVRFGAIKHGAETPCYLLNVSMDDPRKGLEGLAPLLSDTGMRWEFEVVPQQRSEPPMLRVEPLYTAIPGLELG